MMKEKLNENEKKIKVNSMRLKTQDIKIFLDNEIKMKIGFDKLRDKFKLQDKKCWTIMRT